MPHYSAFIETARVPKNIYMYPVHTDHALPGNTALQLLAFCTVCVVYLE